MTSNHAIAEHHREALGGGLQVAARFAQLHGQAVQEFSQAVQQDGPRKRAVVVLGNHSHNIYTAALDLVIRGQFDVAAYLMRPLSDMPGLILATANDEEHAKRLLPGGSGLPASDARRFVEADPELAEALLQEDGVYSYMNQYSHVNPYHAESLLDITDDGIFPTVGGRMDELRARRDASIVCELEMHILAALGNQLPTDSSEEWWEGLGQSVASANQWFNLVGASWAARNERMKRRNSAEPV